LIVIWSATPATTPTGGLSLSSCSVALSVASEGAVKHSVWLHTPHSRLWRYCLNRSLAIMS